MATLKEIQEKIVELQKQAEKLKGEQREEVIEKMKIDIQSYGISPKELGFKKIKLTNGESKPKVKRPAKYKLNEQTWSGQGRPPKWFSDFLDAGGKKEKILINLPNKG